jgi:hydrocephalus-inducing protein
VEETALIHMGDIYINEKHNKALTIVNKGDFNFDFAIKKSNFLNFVQITPEHGTCRKQDKIVIDLQFAPQQECRLLPKNSKFQL